MSYGGDYDDPRARGVPAQTRTHLPERGEPPSSRRPPASPGRSMMTVVGVVVLLIAAIVFANQAGDEGGDGGPAEEGGQADPTAPSGQMPVEGTTSGIPAGFPQNEEGAQSAAANYAVALGGEAMFSTESRHALVDAVYEPQAAEALRPAQDEAYSGEFLDRLGLDEDGEAPAGMDFVSRTVPVGTSLVQFNDTAATVEVWYMGLIGMAGVDSTDPVRTDWRTWTFELAWVDGDWRIVSDAQVDGPAPVPGDVRAADSEAIAEAVEEYGGFTYAR